MRAYLRSLAVVAAITLWASLAQAQTSATRQTITEKKPDAVTMPPDILAAQAFLFATYPDLAGRALVIQMKPEQGQVVMSVVEASSPAEAAEATMPPLLIGRIAFDDHGQLQQFAARGALFDQTRNDLLAKQLVAHPDWGESDLDAWLTSVGGRSTVTGVAPAEVAASSGQPWRNALGQNVSTTPPTFRWRPAADRAGAVKVATTGAPTWVVSATATAADGATLRYVLEYEPFGGRLVAVTRQ